MSVYVDGYVLPVPEANLDAYAKMSKEAGEFWMKHGALGYYECVGDDLHPDMGDFKLPNFPDLVGTKEGETVIFAFVLFKSREHRDEVNKKVMSDPEVKDDAEHPFDVTRMRYGGFRSIVDLSA